MSTIPRYLPEAARCLRPHLRMLENPTPEDQEFARNRLTTFLQEAKLDLPLVIEGHTRYRGPLMGGNYRYIKKLYEFQRQLAARDWYRACLSLEYLVNLKADREKRSLRLIIHYLECALCD